MDRRSGGQSTGCIKPFYPYFIVFIVLCPKGIFSLLNRPINRIQEGWATCHFFNLSISVFSLVLVSQDLKFLFFKLTFIVVCELCSVFMEQIFYFCEFHPHFAMCL
jgi:hypothetical protein